MAATLSDLGYSYELVVSDQKSDDSAQLGVGSSSTGV